MNENVIDVELNNLPTVEEVVGKVNEQFGGRGKYWTKNNIHRIYFPESGKVKSFIELEVYYVNGVEKVTKSIGRVQYVGKPQHPHWVANYVANFKESMESIADFINKQISIKWDNPVLVGKFNVSSNKIIITDPCYDENFNYRNGVRAIVEAENGIWVSFLLKNAVQSYGLLVCKAENIIENTPEIVVENITKTGEYVSTAFVDSGLMSFFDQKQFTEKNYRDIIEKLGDSDYLEYYESGVVSRTFIGDGTYPLFGIRNEQKVFNCLFIKFE